MKGKTVLVVDGGGRCAVLVEKYSKSPKVARILAVPGNDLVKLNCKKPIKLYPYLKTTSVAEIIDICKSEKVDLIDIDQDNAVEAGLSDALTQSGFLAFGPSRLAGQIEWDKAWARDFMRKYKIPIPIYKVCHSKKEGIQYLKKQKDSSWFIKAAGLLYGKGVLPAFSNKEAMMRIEELEKFGEAGKTFLIEEALVGEEFSSFALCDGTTFKVLGHAQDNKRVYNFDEGDNTGGIGCTSPPMIITKKIEKQIHKIFKKTIDGLRKEGRPFVGILYLGGMVVFSKNPKAYVIEFNARWGDPEPEVIVPGIKNDFYDLSVTAVKGNVQKIRIKHDGMYRIVVTGSSHGYPGDYSKVKGKRIFGIKKALKNGSRIYGAAVQVKNGKHFANGGRLFHLMAEGIDVVEAREKAYQAMALISVEGNNLHYRTDIGWRDVERLRKVGNASKN